MSSHATTHTTGACLVHSYVASPAHPHRAFTTDAATAVSEPSSATSTDTRSDDSSEESVPREEVKEGETTAAGATASSTGGPSTANLPGTPYLRRNHNSPPRSKKFALSQSFLDRWAQKKPPFGYNGLGELVYRRTYSRKKIENGIEDGPNEQWHETVARVVNGTYNMQKNWIEEHNLGWNARKAQSSAQEMFERIFNMKFLPPGRGLWAMGSPITEQRKLFAALNNCAFVTTEGMEKDADKSKPFTFLMDASMLGVGVGFDTKGAGKWQVQDASLVEPRVFQIPDTREGWVEALRLLINSYAHGAGRDNVTFDYSLIRPYGTPIRGFGGVASGPAALKELLDSVRGILQARVGSTLTMTDIADIMNMIGRCVVAGNVRRTAEIAFGPPDSEEYLNLKNYEVNPQRSAWSWASNNSVFAELGMDYTKIAEHVKRNGEPGFAWLHNMQNYARMNGTIDARDHRVRGGNPCLEQSLESYELCFPVDQTRVLTDRGFLWYDEVEQLVDRGEVVKYACYDVQSKQLLYRPGELKREFVPAQRELVEFTQDTEQQRNWCDTSGVYGTRQKEDDDDRSNHLSLLVTREHQMYVQLGRVSGSDYDKIDWRKIGNDQAPPGKYAAESLLPDAPVSGLPQPRAGPKTPYSHLRFVCAAESGVGETQPDDVCALLSGALDLETQDQVDAFIEVYGLWLGDGTLDALGKYVMFNQHKESDVNWLCSILPRAGLASADWTKTWNPSNSRWDIRVSNPHWWKYFAGEYGAKYGFSRADHDDICSPSPMGDVDEAKWFAPWVSQASREQLRLMITGLWRADGAWAHQKKTIFTSSVTFRDALVKVLLHAGYSAFFALGYPRGTERGAALGHSVIASRDAWVVKFAEPTSSSGQTYAFPNMRRSDARVVPYAGKVWCVKVQHDDHLIVAQRAHRVGDVTTKASRPTIVGNCCLVETFPTNHTDLEDFQKTLKYAYLYAKTVTLGRTQWPETNRVMLRNRRIGCSVSGVAQFISQRGLEELRRWLETGYATIQQKDQEFSDWFAIPRSIKTTSVKPSGTVSLLAGATPGMHYPESRFYIRRMRLSASSELLQPLIDAGYPVEPVKDGDAKTLVVEFPIDVGAGVRVQNSVSMHEQLALAAFLQRHWADNQVSCTVTFDPETEGQHLAPALDYYQYQLKGISFLPKLKEGAYAQMPYEAITEEEYNRRFAALKPLQFADARVRTEETNPERFCDADICNVDGSGQAAGVVEAFAVEPATAEDQATPAQQ